MTTDARADDALYVTNKALARIEGLVAAGDVDISLAMIARRAMDAALCDADAVWQARDNVRQASYSAKEADEKLVLPAASLLRQQALAAAPMGFHEPERPVEKPKSRRGAPKSAKTVPNVD